MRLTRAGILGFGWSCVVLTLGPFALLGRTAIARGGTAASGEPGYEFTLDGKPFKPDVISMRGDSDQPSPGDVIQVEEIWLTLGQERACHFTTTPENDGRLWLQLSNSKRRVIGASIKWSYEDDERVVYNPLSKLSSAEVQGLWGIYLDDWPDGVAEKLAQADLTRVCLTVTDGVARGKTGKLPSLPAKLRHLIVDEHSNQGIRDYDTLRGLSQLRLLLVDVFTARSFNAELIAKNQSLRYLRLTTRSLQNPKALGQLANLGWLDLTYIRDLGTVEFAETLSELRCLRISRTRVRDLSPLARAAKLEEVVASMSPVEKLASRPRR
jgi:Leucine-rich repeat (LRR) protein